MRANSTFFFAAGVLLGAAAMHWFYSSQGTSGASTAADVAPSDDAIVAVDVHQAQGRAFRTGEVAGASGLPAPFGRAVERTAAQGNEGRSIDLASADETWLSRLNAAPSEAAASKVLADMAKLPEARGVELLLGIWGRVAPEHSRVPASRVFLEALDEGCLALMDASVGDDAFSVQNGGLKAASRLALRNFVESSRDYAPWRGRMQGLGLRATLEASAIEFVARLAQFSEIDLVVYLRDFDDYPGGVAERLGLDLGGFLLGHGLRRAVSRLVTSHHEDADEAIRRLASNVDIGPALIEEASLLLGGGAGEARARALQLLKHAEIPEDFARQSLLPIVTGFAMEEPTLVASAATLLGDAGFKWATDALGQAVQDPRIHGSITSSFSMGQAFSALGDPRSIPTLIGVIAAHDDYETVYGLGYFGLRKLTGVDYSEAHDGEFWLQWWSENRDRFGPEVASMAVPAVPSSSD